MPSWEQLPEKKPPAKPPEPEDKVLQSLQGQPLRIHDSEFPEELQRGGSKRLPYRPAPMPEHIERRRKEVQDYYQDTPPEERVYPAPKKRNNLRTGLSVVFVILVMIGAAMAIMNFVYARGSTNLATSISFLHAEIAVVCIALLIGFVVLDWKV